jgi:hypothetical protein
MACKPKKYGGIGTLDLAKFASALRMRWLWHEWNDEAKPWIGLGNPCTIQDHELFATAAKISIGYRKKALFLGGYLARWNAPRDIAPLIFQSLQAEELHHQQSLGQQLLGLSSKHASGPIRGAYCAIYQSLGDSIGDSFGPELTRFYLLEAHQ